MARLILLGQLNLWSTYRQATILIVHLSNNYNDGVSYSSFSTAANAVHVHDRLHIYPVWDLLLHLE